MIVHYEMQERPVGESIRVRALVYGQWQSWMTTHSKVSPEGIPYFPVPVDYSYDPYTEYVYPPGRLARLFGDTLQKRLARARKKVEARARRATTRGAALYTQWSEGAA